MTGTQLIAQRAIQSVKNLYSNFDNDSKVEDSSSTAVYSGKNIWLITIPGASEATTGIIAATPKINQDLVITPVQAADEINSNFVTVTYNVPAESSNTLTDALRAWIIRASDLMKEKEAAVWYPDTSFKQSGALDTVFYELRKSREEDFQVELYRLRNLADVQARVVIAERLETLLEDFQDEYDHCLDLESLRLFVSLLSLNPQLKRPIITATESGCLVVEWKSEDKTKFLGLQMLSIHKVRFVAFRPSEKNPQLRKHVSGETSVNELFSDLVSYNIKAWADTN